MSGKKTSKLTKHDRRLLEVMHQLSMGQQAQLMRVISTDVADEAVEEADELAERLKRDAASVTDPIEGWLMSLRSIEMQTDHLLTEMQENAVTMRREGQLMVAGCQIVKINLQCSLKKARALLKAEKRDLRGASRSRAQDEAA